jgi:hypothetical protein
MAGIDFFNWTARNVFARVNTSAVAGLQRCDIRYSSPRRLLSDLVVLKKNTNHKGEIRMENENMDSKKSSKSARVTLKTVAEYLGLTPGTISAVLNDTPEAVRIPQATKAHSGSCPRNEWS